MKPSDVSNLLQQVVEEINENEFHPLHRFCSYNYYTDFFTMVEILFAHGYFNTQKERKSFFNRMQFNSKFNEMRYYQGVSELLFIYFALDHQLTFVTDKKLLLNSNNDIDLQITDNGFHYNVEIILAKKSEAKFEMAFDHVTYQDDSGHKAYDYQIEIELKSDYIHRVNLKMLTDDLERKVSKLESSTESKYKRGLTKLSVQ